MYENYIQNYIENFNRFSKCKKNREIDRIKELVDKMIRMFNQYKKLIENEQNIDKKNKYILLQDKAFVNIETHKEILIRTGSPYE